MGRPRRFPGPGGVGERCARRRAGDRDRRPRRIRPHATDPPTRAAPATPAVGSLDRPAELTAGALSERGQRAQLSARAECANLAGADALVSIHYNSFNDPEVRGTETLYEPDRAFGAGNRRLAALLHGTITRAYADLGRSMPDRGVRGGPDSAQNPEDLVVLAPPGPDAVGEPSAMPGAVIEPLFITNPADAELAASPRGKDALARAITLGVDEFLSPR